VRNSVTYSSRDWTNDATSRPNDLAAAFVIVGGHLSREIASSAAASRGPERAAADKRRVRLSAGAPQARRAQPRHPARSSL
jgi:hypothetical protein